MILLIDMLKGQYGNINLQIDVFRFYILLVYSLFLYNPIFDIRKGREQSKSRNSLCESFWTVSFYC